MAKRPRTIGSNEMENLFVFFNSDSEAQFASDESDNDFTRDFPEDSDGIVEADEEWRERIRENKARGHISLVLILD
jgi:hypothetical protein